ncbi:hypothetical protein COV18_05555 [Candidatus Woesearchaeota archaeon CG10_big_fil_rev_8_21_14_0_10_37_12]|nr:MAG: hypothetical protein COV18_05555 [Candidatus Woesearchaeota archaeon CG10_big_fil_rev_8_21_14_0_10_37_12]
MKRAKHLFKFILLIALLSLTVYIFKFSPLSETLTQEFIHDFVLSFGTLSFLIFIVVYALGTLVSVPGTILTFVGAILFGTWFGTLVNLLGATIGASLAFFVAQYLGRDFVKSLMGERLNEFEKKVEKNGFAVILLLRLIPIFPFIGINYASGLTKIKFKDYFFATLLGMIPGTFIYTYLFAIIGEKILADGFQLTNLLSVEVLIPLVLFAVLIAGTTWYKRSKMGQNNT